MADIVGRVILTRVACLLAWISIALAGVSPSIGDASSLQAPSGARVRLHHVHYHVADPAAAMNDVARRTGAVRVIAPGLGVGVRAGREYVLFDRLDASTVEHAGQPPLAEAYDVARRWLADRGVQVELGAPLSASPFAGNWPDARYDHIAFVTADLRALDERIAQAGGKALRRSEDAVLFDAGHGLSVEIVRDADRDDAFWCPMHPDVRSPDAGTCHLCGMNLVPIPPPKIGEYRIDVTQLRGSRQSVTGLQLAVREPDTGALVTKYALVHERIFHLFVVSRDLRYFAHLHPDQQAGGLFQLAHALPPGEYMLIADFLPEGAAPQMVQKAIIVSGQRQALPVADESNGLRVRMTADDLAPGRHAQLTFTVEDAATGKAVTDLQPYLGAPAHLLMVRGDLSDAIHGHPEERQTGGPTVSFHPIIPAEGAYRIWIQFQRAGRVSTHVFDLTVAR